MSSCCSSVTRRSTRASAKLWRWCVSRGSEDRSADLVIQHRNLVEMDPFEGVEARSIGHHRSKDGRDQNFSDTFFCAAQAMGDATDEV